MNNECVVLRPVAAWTAEHTSAARAAPFLHRCRDTRTIDLAILARRRECFIELAAGVRQAAPGDMKLASWLQAVTENRSLWARDWDSDWLVNHYHSRFARNGFIVMRPALESLDRADALELAFGFLDAACPSVKLTKIQNFAA